MLCSSKRTTLTPDQEEADIKIYPLILGLFVIGRVASAAFVSDLSNSQLYATLDYFYANAQSDASTTGEALRSEKNAFNRTLLTGSYAAYLHTIEGLLVNTLSLSNGGKALQDAYGHISNDEVLILQNCAGTDDQAMKVCASLIDDVKVNLKTVSIEIKAVATAK